MKIRFIHFAQLYTCPGELLSKNDGVLVGNFRKTSQNLPESLLMGGAYIIFTPKRHRFCQSFSAQYPRTYRDNSNNSHFRF